MRDLIDEDIIHAGEDVLSVEYKGNMTYATLLPEGHILCQVGAYTLEQMAATAFVAGTMPIEQGCFQPEIEQQIAANHILKEKSHDQVKRMWAAANVKSSAAAPRQRPDL